MPCSLNIQQSWTSENLEDVGLSWFKVSSLTFSVVWIFLAACRKFLLFSRVCYPHHSQNNPFQRKSDQHTSILRLFFSKTKIKILPISQKILCDLTLYSPIWTRFLPWFLLCLYWPPWNFLSISSTQPAYGPTRHEDSSLISSRFRIQSRFMRQAYYEHPI